MADIKPTGNNDPQKRREELLNRSEDFLPVENENNLPQEFIYEGRVVEETPLTAIENETKDDNDRQTAFHSEENIPPRFKFKVTGVSFEKLTSFSLNGDLKIDLQEVPPFGEIKPEDIPNLVVNTVSEVLLRDGIGKRLMVLEGTQVMSGKEFPNLKKKLEQLLFETARGELSAEYEAVFDYTKQFFFKTSEKAEELWDRLVYGNESNPRKAEKNFVDEILERLKTTNSTEIPASVLSAFGYSSMTPEKWASLPLSEKLHIKFLSAFREVLFDRAKKLEGLTEEEKEKLKQTIEMSIVTLAYKPDGFPLIRELRGAYKQYLEKGLILKAVDKAVAGELTEDDFLVQETLFEEADETTRELFRSNFIENRELKKDLLSLSEEQGKWEEKKNALAMEYAKFIKTELSKEIFEWMTGDDRNKRLAMDMMFLGFSNTFLKGLTGREPEEYTRFKECLSSTAEIGKCFDRLKTVYEQRAREYERLQEKIFSNWFTGLYFFVGLVYAYKEFSSTVQAKNVERLLSRLKNAPVGKEQGLFGEKISLNELMKKAKEGNFWELKKIVNKHAIDNTGFTLVSEREARIFRAEMLKTYLKNNNLDLNEELERLERELLLNGDVSSEAGGEIKEFVNILKAVLNPADGGLGKGFASEYGIPKSSLELVNKIDELIGRYAEVLAEKIKPEDVEEAFAFYLNRQKEILTEELSSVFRKELGKNAENIDINRFVEKILGKETGRIAEKQFIVEVLSGELSAVSPLTLDKIAEKVTETYFKAREKAKEEGAFLLADKIAKMEGVELSFEQKQKLALNLKNAVIQRRISPHDIIPFAGGLFREKFKGLFKASNFILMMDNMTFKPEEKKDAVILANPLLFNSLYPDYSPVKAFEIKIDERTDRFKNLTGIDLKQVLGETEKLYGPFFFEAVKRSIKHQLDKAKEEMQGVSYIQRPV